MKIFTIGFTKKTAEEFFSRLKRPEILRVVDVRLNNVSQLAGFAKKEDLRYFLREICRIEYVHLAELAPTQELLDAYKKKKGEWSIYADAYLELLKQRRVETSVPQNMIDGSCLLCSEDTSEHCHRSLAAEYFQQHWERVEIIHL